jgi:hypothetical protein
VELSAEAFGQKIADGILETVFSEIETGNWDLGTGTGGW